MNTFDWPTFHYRGKILRSVDGDTVHVRLDLGLRVYTEVSLRIADINAPELYRADDAERERGRAARDFVAQYEGRDVYIATYKDKQSFTRYVATIYVEQDGELRDLADIIVANGHAVRVQEGSHANQ